MPETAIDEVVKLSKERGADFDQLTSDLLPKNFARLFTSIGLDEFCRSQLLFKAVVSVILKFLGESLVRTDCGT